VGRRWEKYVVPLFLLVAVACLVGIMRWTAFERSQLSFIESGLRDALSPLERSITFIVYKTGDWLAYIKGYGRLQAENQALRRKVAELEASVVQLMEYKQENDRLRKLLHYTTVNSHKYDFAVAPVIGRNPTNWYSTITIGLGSKAGLKKDQVVLTSRGVVGRIINVTPLTSEVLLILDREGALGGMIQSNRTPGIVEGCPDYRGYLQMVHISRDAPVAENQIVITSGLGDFFPKGLLIGTIVKVQPEIDGLMKRAIIAPSVDFNRLEEVLVITGIKEEAHRDAIPGADGPGAGKSGFGDDTAAVS